MEPSPHATNAHRPAALALGLCLSVVMLPAAYAPLWDADLWWILRAGGEILDARALPRSNAWSFTAPEHPWVMHEWLLGGLYAALARALGLGSIALTRVAALAVTAAALASLAWRSSRPTVAAPAVCLSLLVFAGRFESARPIAPALCLASVTIALAFAPRWSRRRSAALVALAWLWASSHGSFALAPILVAASAFERAGDERRTLLVTAGCMALATALTPYGIGLHALVLRYLTGANADALSLVHARILEWTPLLRDPLRVATAPALVCATLITAAAALLLRDPRWRPRALVVLAFALMALRHNRHLSLLGLLSPALLSAPIEALLASRRGTYAPARLPTLAIAAPTAAALALCVAVLASRPMTAWVDPTRDDDDAAALVRSLPAEARVFVALPYTGWFLFNAPRGATVFFDTRNDCYPAGVLREGFDLNDGLLAPELADRTLRTRGATHALVPCTSRAARGLALWPVTRRAGNLCLLAPASPDRGRPPAPHLDAHRPGVP